LIRKADQGCPAKSGIARLKKISAKAARTFNQLILCALRAVVVKNIFFFFALFAALR